MRRNEKGVGVGQLLGAVLPLFAIIGLGKLAVYFDQLDAAGSAALSRFAFRLPVPALLFGVMAEGPTVDVLGPSGLYFLGCLLIYVLALFVGRWLSNPSWSHSAVFALDATFGNVTFLGLPLVFSLYGSEGLSVLIGMIVLTTLFLPLSSLLMEIGTPRPMSRLATFRKISVDLLKSPAVYPIILGLCWRATGFALPLAVHTFIDLFAKAAAPIALFCVGTSLPPMSWDVIQEASTAAFLKLVAAPLVVGGLCFWAGFTDAALAIPMIAAALPTGANAFLLARGATSHATASATTVVMATGFSLLTVSLLVVGLDATTAIRLTQ
jgi:malonate transporter